MAARGWIVDETAPVVLPISRVELPIDVTSPVNIKISTSAVLLHARVVCIQCH